MLWGSLRWWKLRFRAARNVPNSFSVQVGLCRSVLPLVPSSEYIRTGTAGGWRSENVIPIEIRSDIIAGASPVMRDSGRGLRAEQWARFCGRTACADVIEKFSRSKTIDRNGDYARWGSEPELAARLLGGKVCNITDPSFAGTGDYSENYCAVFETFTEYNYIRTRRADLNF